MVWGGGLTSSEQAALVRQEGSSTERQLSQLILIYFHEIKGGRSGIWGAEQPWLLTELRACLCCSPATLQTGYGHSAAFHTPFHYLDSCSPCIGLCQLECCWATSGLQPRLLCHTNHSVCLNPAAGETEAAHHS